MMVRAMSSEPLRLPRACPYRVKADAHPFIGQAEPGERQYPLFDDATCCKSHHMIYGKDPLCQTLGHEDEAYRFDWQRSFHPHIITRIGRSGDRITSTVWSAYSEPDQNGSRALAPEDWVILKLAIDRAQFWTSEPSERLFGLDGAFWLFEGREDERFHVAQRWSPEAGPFRELGLTFLELAGVHVPASELY